MNRGEHKLRAVAAAVKRLKASDTPRKRTNALKAFARAMKDLQVSVAAAFSKLRSDGTAIVRRKRRGAWCPHCKRPMKNLRQLANHLTEILNPPGRRIPECWCKRQFRNHRHLRQHLAGIPDLRQHFTPNALQEFAQELSP